MDSGLCTLDSELDLCMPAPGRKAPGERRGAHEVLHVAGREVTISNPGKILFPVPKYTKLDLVRYYLDVA